MNDDELRERLRAMPEPTATIDVDAVVADARRRRRPKVVGVGVAAVAGCLAFLAPVVVPGLLGPDPVTASLQDQGVAEQAPAGGEPGDAADPSQPSVLGAPASPDDAGGDDAVPIAACGAVASERIAPGLDLSFAAPPVDGAAMLRIGNDGEDPLALRIGDVGLAAVDGQTVLAASDLDLLSAADGTAVEVAPGESVTIAVDVDTTLAPCATSEPLDGEQVPLVVVSVESGSDGIGPALGSAVGP